MERISVIVPIYHGRKYINGMIAQIESCVAECHGEYALELLFVNDSPDEPIGSLSSEKIAIRVIESDRNRGIHGARVRGLEHCSSDYILFLDQDDRIQSAYFSSQLAHLGGGDAVVCKLLHEGRQFYDTRMPFEQVITKKYIISVRNPIISPGQVLLKKEKIPEIWRRAKLENNGADDWLLWVCMLAEGHRFALNQEILFEHVVAGNNESINAKNMIDSERELYRIIAENELLTDNELKELHAAVQNAAEDHIKVLSKFQKMFFVYDTWMSLYEQGFSIEDYLAENGIHSVAIYGFSYIGKRLQHSLDKGKVCVKYFIDMNAEYLSEETVPIYVPDGHLPETDMIIISLVEAVDGIRKKLTDLSDAKICAMTELLDNMRNTI